MRLIFTTMGQPERRFNVDAGSDAAVNLFRSGKHRDGIDALDSAMRLAGPTADHYYVKSLMLTIQGRAGASPQGSAELYRQANDHLGEAVARDGRFLKNFGMSIPETRWAIPGYADLITREPGLLFRVLRAARACTFAPAAAIRALEDDRVRAVAAERTYGMTSPCEDAITRLRAASQGRSAGPDDAARQKAEVVEAIHRYEHAPGPGQESCADGEWADELALPAGDLVCRLAGGLLAERVRAACILGVRGERSAAVVAALRSVVGDRNLQVRVQALIARTRLAASPGADDGTLVDDLIRALRQDRSYLVQSAAADALASMKAKPEDIVPALVELLTSANPKQKRARPSFMGALGRYGRADATVVAAIQGFEPHENDEQAFIRKASALARLSPDPEVVAQCVRFLERVQREANWEHTRQLALVGLLDAPAAACDAAAVLVERVYLDPAVSVRDYARYRLMRLDHELAVRLNAYEDKS